ncbi:hypothetical protein LINGRAPRIM_LOCUS2156 [Linum grandiflorum]
MAQLQAWIGQANNPSTQAQQSEQIHCSTTLMPPFGSQVRTTELGEAKSALQTI